MENETPSADVARPMYASPSSTTGAVPKDPRAKRVTTMPELMKLLKDIWFTPYRRWRAAASENRHAVVASMAPDAL